MGKMDATRIGANEILMRPIESMTFARHLVNSIVKTTKILLVDDDMFVLGVNETMLNNGGFEVVIANRPGIALEKLRSIHKSIDIIITDFIMPEMTGIEMIQDLRLYESSKNLPFIPVILCSGHDEPAFKANAYENTVSEVLVKPVDRDTLISSINMHKRVTK